MATPLGNMVVHLGLDNSGFQSKLRQTTGSIKSFKNDIKKMENQLKTSQAMSKYALNGREAFKAYGYQVKDLNRLITTHSQYQSKLVGDYNRVAAGTRGLADDLKATNKQYREAKGLYGENSEQAKAYAVRLDEIKGAMESGTKQAENLAREYENSRQKLFQYRSELKEAIETQYSQHSLTARLGKGLTTIGNGLSTVSQKTRGMTVGIAAGFGVAVKSAVQFEDGMNTIKALIADDVPESKMSATMDKLSSAVKNYAKTYGMSTGEVIEGMQEMIRRGYDVNQTMESMPHVLQASKASGEDFGTVMHATTAILEQFNLQAKDTQRVTDSLTYVANKTASDYSTLGAAMEYVGPMAATAGISLEQTASAIGLLSQRGIEGEKAGTNLRAILTTLVAPTKNNAKAWKQLGVSTDAFLAGSIDLADVLDLVKTNTEGLTDAQKASLISQAVGRTGQAGMNALVAQGGDALRNLTSATEGATGSTKKMSDQMMQSSKNQFKQFLSQLETLGIEIGNELLPILKDLLDDGEKVVEWFHNLNPQAKESAVKFALATAAISPFTGALGLIAKVGGGTLSTIATLTGKLKLLKMSLTGAKEISGATQTLSALGGVAGATEGSVGALGGALGGLASPAGLVVGSLALLAGGMFALQTYLDYNKAKSEEWGTTLSGQVASDVTQLKGKVDETKDAVIQFESGTTQNAENVIKAFQQMNEAIGQYAEDTKSKLKKIADKEGLLPEEVAAGEAYIDQKKANVQAMTDQIVAIYQRHNNDVSQLTAEEKQIVLNNQSQMVKAELDMMDLSGKQKKAIMTAINGDVTQLNETQLKKQKTILDKAMKAEQKSYEEHKKNTEELYKNGYLTKENYNTRMQALESKHTAIMSAYGEKYAATIDELAKYEGRSGMGNVWSKAADKMKKYGLKLSDLNKKAKDSAEKLANVNNMFAKSTADMSADAKNANDQWNALVFDPKEGKVKTNATEEVAKALAAEGGWDQMQFVLKNANLTTNARLTIAEALVANGQWANLKPEEKELVVDNKKGLMAIAESTDLMGKWDAMPETVKNILANDKDFTDKAKNATNVLNNWNNLSPDAKDLIAKNLATLPTKEAQAVIDSLTGKEVDLNALNLALGGVTQAQSDINTLTGKTVGLFSIDQTTGQVVTAQSNIDSVQQKTLPYLNIGDNTAGGTSSAQSNIDGVQQKTLPYLNVGDHTASGTSSAKENIKSVKGKTVSIKASDNTSGPTSSAKENIKGVKGKTVNIGATDNASGVLRGINGELGLLHDKTITVNVKYKKHANGTNYHPGGLAMVNDQKNANYKELVTLPGGVSFIPEGRNVILPLPRGSKVLKASKTKSLMQKYGLPKYANGVGYSANSPLFKAMDSVQQKISVTPAPEVNIDNAQVLLILKEIANLLRDGNKKVPVAKVYMDGELITRKVTEEQNRRSRIESIMKGVPI
jgi:TP901 family phage tail tape measure protein